MIDTIWDYWHSDRHHWKAVQIEHYTLPSDRIGYYTLEVVNGKEEAGLELSREELEDLHQKIGEHLGGGDQQ